LTAADYTSLQHILLRNGRHRFSIRRYLHHGRYRVICPDSEQLDNHKVWTTKSIPRLGNDILRFVTVDHGCCVYCTSKHDFDWKGKLLIPSVTWKLFISIRSLLAVRLSISHFTMGQYQPTLTFAAESSHLKTFALIPSVLRHRWPMSLDGLLHSQHLTSLIRTLSTGVTVPYSKTLRNCSKIV
jgi:hypothetical protein